MICVSNKKAVICKGDFHPAQLYKGEKKISGYSLEEFTGADNVTLENCYNDRVYDAQITGKNLFNSNQLLQAEGWVENNGEYSGPIGNLWARFNRDGRFDVPIPLGAPRICISFEGRNATKNVNTFSFQIYYTDGTSTLWVGVVNSTEWAEYKVQSVLGKTVESIKCGYNQSDTIYLRKIQITATEDYETYEPPLLDATITARGKNLFDKNNVKDGFYVSQKGDTSNAQMCCTNYFIPIKPNTEYTWTSLRGSHGYGTIFYDESKSSASRVFINTLSFTTPDNAHYMKLNVLISEKETFQLVKGASLGNYEPYIEPQTILFKNGNLTADIPTFKGTTVIEVESDIAATISGKYKKVEEL